MTAEKLLERYAAGERDFGGVDLSGANLSEADLEFANFREANGVVGEVGESLL